VQNLQKVKECGWIQLVDERANTIIIT